jgi:alpha-1,6-mannosyltransferase
MESSWDVKTKQSTLLAIVVAGTASLIIIGRGAPPILFIMAVVGTFLAYAGLIASLTKLRLISARALILACAALMILAIAVPARSSRDVWAYVMYGRIVAQHHASPYTHVPLDYPNDPALQRVQPAFRDVGSVYGPVFTGVSAAGMSVCGSSPVCGRVFFQTLEALAVFGAAALVGRATKSWAAAACVGLNPVLIVNVVNGAHADGLVAAGLLASVLLARERPVLAGTLLGIVSLIKINAMLPAAVLIVWLLVRSDRRRALIVGGTTTGLVGAGYLVAGGARALRPLHNTAMFVSPHSLWFPLERWMTSDLTEDGWRHARAAGYAAHLIPQLGLILVIIVALLVAGGRLRDHGPEPVVAAALAVYVLASPYVLPWYTATVIPLLATRWRSRTTWLMLSYSALLFLAYPARSLPHPNLSADLLPTTARDVLPVVEVLVLMAVAIAAWRPRSHMST